MKKLSFVFLALILFATCNSPFTPEINPRAWLEVSMLFEPVVFQHDFWYRKWNLSNSVILVERNGIGGRLNFIRADLISDDEVYLTKSLVENYGFKSRERMTFNCEFNHMKHICQSLVIAVRGIDNNGYEINTLKTFNLSYKK